MHAWTEFLTALPLWASIGIKITLVLAAGWLFHWAIPGRNPRWRVLLWRGVMVGLIAIVLAELFLPSLDVRVQSIAASTSSSANETSAMDRARETPVPTAAMTPQVFAAPQTKTSTIAEGTEWAREHGPLLLVSAWGLVSVLLLIRMAFTARSLRRLIAQTQPASPQLRRILTDIALKIRAPRTPDLRISAQMLSPFLTGYMRPVIVIPEQMTAESFRDDLRAVFAHELAHLANRDPLWMAIAKLLSIVLWFHPLAWRLPAAHASACEAVCDGVAAEHMGGAPQYAKLLARVAVSLATAEPVLAGVPMLRTSEIGRRLNRLKRGIQSSALSRRMVIAVTLAGMMALGVTGAVKFVRAEPGTSPAKIDSNAAPNKTVVESNTVSVKVVDEDGQPVSGAKLTPDGLRTKVESGSHYGWREDFGPAYEAVTNVDGVAMVMYPKYVIENAETGAISFTVHHPEYATARPTQFSVDGTAKPVVLERAATVKANALSESGKPLRDRVYAITGFEALLARDAWSNAGDGALVTKKFPSGKHHLRLVQVQENGPTLFSDAVLLDLEKGKEYAHEFTLKRGVRVEGKLDATAQRPIRNGRAVVTVFPPDLTDKSLLCMWTTSSAIAEDGSFAFDSLPPGDAECTAVCEGFVSANPPGEESNSLGQPQSFSIAGEQASIELKMIPAAACEITVVTSDGKPVEGAKVHFWPNVQWHRSFTNIFCGESPSFESIVRMTEPELKAAFQKNTGINRYAATTNAQGVARISTLLPGSHNFSVLHDAFELPSQAQSPSRYANATLVSGKTAHVSATVFPKGTKVATNNNAGNVGAAPKSAPATAILKATPGSFSGIVTDDAGKPLEGVLVDAWTWHPGNETHTDAQGRFTLAKFDDDTDAIEVRFSKENYCPVLIANQPLVALGEPIELGNKTYFEGRVTLPDGSPAAGASIRANQGPKDGPGVMISDIWTETASGADGLYRLYVQDDTYDIQVHDATGNVARISQTTIAKDQAQVLDIQLKAGVVFQSKVLDSVTGKPVENVRLSNWQHKGIEGRSNANGEIAISGLFPGTFEFQVDADRYARWWSEECISKWNRMTIDDEKSGWQRNFDDLDFDLQPGMQPVTIVVEKGVRIRGQIVDPDGRPVAGATAAPARTGSGNSLTGDTRFSVKTKDDGSFEMKLPASKDAEYNLVAHDGKYGEWRTWANGVADPFKTKPGDEIDGVVLQLTRPGTVRGVAVDEAGKPVAGREVRASAFDKRENRYYDPTTKTDENGAFELRFVRPGRQYIQLAPFWLRADEAPDGSSQIVTVESEKTVEDVKLVDAKPKSQPPIPQPQELNAKLKVGEAAPDFTGKALDGSSVGLSAYKDKIVLLDFWATWCGPCVAELPNVIQAYNDFHEKGLEIVGISLDTDRDKLEQFLNEHPEMKWPQVYDGTGWDGEIAKQYGVNGIPFTLLLDGKGTIRFKSLRGGELRQAVATMLKGEVSEASPAPSAPHASTQALPKPQEWKAAFDAVYHLKDNEVLRRVAPPFIPERMEYYRFADSGQAEAIPSGPDYFSFHWDDELKRWGCGFGYEEGLSLPQIMGLLGVNRYEIEGPQELLDLALPGDWIMRTDSSIEDRLKALEAIVADATGHAVHFEHRSVEREVVSAKGAYEFHSEAKAHNPRAINIYADSLDPDEGAGGGSGTLTEFLAWTGNRIRMPILNETDQSDVDHVEWANNKSSAMSRVEADQRSEKIDMVLANLSRQTSLQYTRQRRTIDIWFVTEKKDPSPEN